MRILLTGNCQMDGLAVFLRRALPQHEIRSLPHLAIFYAEFTEAQILEHHAWADIVFFHHKHDGAQAYPTKQSKVPMSVWYQSGPFIAHTSEEDWQTIMGIAKYLGNERAIEIAVTEANLHYESNWIECWNKMRAKEQDEQVPAELRISDLMEKGRNVQLQLTCNHPTSIVFWHWTHRICAFLGETAHPNFFGTNECIEQPNLAGLPCEESATTGARKHLSLNWGARPEDDESGRLICRQRLGLV